MTNSETSNRDVPAAFTLAVDNELRSYGGDLSPVHGFSSAVNCAINSYGEDLGGFHSPEHNFASVVNNAMASDGEDLGASHPPVHGFPSSTDHAISSNGGDLGGSSSPVHGFQLYPLAELVAATDNFSLQNMIGAGSIGVVYRAELVAGGEVAIKRVEVSWSKRKELHEIVRGYLLAFLSRLHHKHLVELVGFCAEKDKRLFVFEYMKNGALYDHLHCKGSRVLNSWKRRIKIALDASRGIQYLHNYAVPCIIHGDIKSSNILLDATWTARVSDFGLSFMKKTAGTVGYIDPEYLAGHAVTAKSDVYGFGVVLLELLTGKTAIFKSGDDGGSVVDFAVPHILSGEWVKILDPRIGPPDENEADAVELVTYTALHCVNLEGKDRPTIDEVVVNLESALASCCHSGTIPVVSVVLPTKKKKKNFFCFTRKYC